jgi:hypothetical protein
MCASFLSTFSLNGQEMISSNRSLRNRKRKASPEREISEEGLTARLSYDDRKLLLLGMKRFALIL